MIYSVQITSRAETDLREIYGYIAYELLSPPTAARQLQRLEEEILKSGSDAKPVSCLSGRTMAQPWIAGYVR